MTLRTAKGLKGHGHQHEARHMCENAANLYDEKGVHTIQPIDGPLALRYMRTAAVPATPKIVGDARIHSQETQSLNRVERKSVDGVRGLLTQVRYILRECLLNVLRDWMRDSTTHEAIVDLTDTRCVRISGSVVMDAVLSFGVWWRSSGSPRLMK